LTVGTVEARVVAIGTHNAGREIVGNEAVRDTAKERKRGDVSVEPGSRVFTEGQIHEHMAAAAQRHDEGVEPPRALGLGIEPAPT